MRGAAILGIVLVLVAGLGSAAVLAPPPEPESLVEGHTVFVVLEQVDARARNETEYATAVAVLVRERIVSEERFRFPGVLWFNDQYLVNPESVETSDARFRHPCHGAVIAVNAGDPVPMRGAWPSNDGAAYVESYQLLDPNDHAWVVDKWSWTTGGRNVTLWTVPILGHEWRSNQTDDGECDAPPHGDGGDLLRGVRVGGIDGRDPGRHGMGYPCGDAGGACPRLQYNALLYFLLADLTVAHAAKDHAEESADWLGDASGCHDPSWPCPDGDDDREGNSHAYDPLLPRRAPAKDGGHGGSAGADAHATRRVDVHYGVAAPPAADRVWRVTDGEGSTAPSHCHEASWCGAGALI